MAGVPNRSGGRNRRSLDELVLGGTYRPDRHRHLTEAPSPALGLSASDRRRTLAGLVGPARKLALRLLGEYSGWSPTKLEVLRNYVLSCARLERMQSAAGDDLRELHREVRCNLNLLRALDLGD
jgi:hypothetical protein